MKKDIIVIRGGGDIATGTIHKLHRCGFKVVILEIENPSAIRRSVCFSEAVYENKIVVENVVCEKASNLEEVYSILDRNNIPMIIDPFGKYIEKLKPFALVDAILAKKNLGTKKDMAPITIALGPGFCAGEDVDMVIETMRGHDLGRIIEVGYAIANTGVPGPVKGVSEERVIYSPSSGIISSTREIGDIVKKGEVIAKISNTENETEVKATIDGVLRGIIRDKSKIKERLKIADIDPRIEEVKNSYTISDKARTIAGGVLEAILYMKQKHEVR
ncbi:EF2563 family selenium-dependent molybdenum hydroxylase system protein [Terrisporobacter petrolearius]|uniref:selenium-dependent molybdenum cofactor biosynthesis protein YqeB n=1 Tax=Terrisporobacter petrolearius TaxID=1460447 RepID=UPI001D168A55|nr:selenium-dependent molybdenum cofactor biosynthesis protein YqeB [Terrisporobacter petrolearius]MCC3865278.1 EF2563 family selenium-dependent molybdenum hydroxylase system protein [Terrisporobacter petrolearius]